MDRSNFNAVFENLTGKSPFPWQWDLYANWFAVGKFPDSCSLPTGLGKTSVVAIWLIALSTAPPGTVPRRLVYVVNRRTVVDQTTDEAERLQEKAEEAGVVRPEISTLRGQFADNRKWSEDPSRPAIIVGTVDMIGSRLLFSGYGVGFKARPLHAGFLGQDALLVHDEAHLEPAFQELLLSIQREQQQCKEFRPLRVMEMSATPRSGGELFTLSDADRAEPEVQKRIGAKKTIRLHENRNEKKLAEEIADLALEYKDSGKAVLVFVRKVDDVEKVVARLRKAKQKEVRPLTGTLRGYERDQLVEHPVFQRFLPDAEPGTTTAYLVCTSAGEVGVNISADHLICDLTTFDSMAQRFGRVNRFGKYDDTRIDIVHPESLDVKDDYEARLRKTLELLRLANGDGSPSALSDLHRKAMREGSETGSMHTDQTRELREYLLATYAPQPRTLPVSDILFDAWVLTTVRDLPDRPPVDEYLHGVEAEKQRETHVAWRAEVDRFRGTAVTQKQLSDLFDEFPLRSHELLRDTTWRIQDQLTELAEAHENASVWVIDPDDTVRVLNLGQLAQKDNKKRYVENLSGRTIVLPPSVGGLTETGTLGGREPHDPEREYDVAGRMRLASGSPLVRLLVTGKDETLQYKLIAPVRDLPPDFAFAVDPDGKGEGEKRCLRDEFMAKDFAPMRVAYRLDLAGGEEDGEGLLEYLVLKAESRQKVLKREAGWPSLDGHLEGVKTSAEEICSRLALSSDVHTAVTLAAEWHDLGKDRAVWQRGAGNTRRAKPVAKTLHGRSPENLNGFRHELASMVDVCSDPAFHVRFRDQTSDCRELLLHLIAAHHGRGRPHFPDAEVIDPERVEAGAVSVAAETPQRFARLQRQYGRWGLAYLESLLRAADALDSRRIEETPIGESEPGTWPRPVPPSAWPERKLPTASITVAVDPTNPGQYFACCGLLEIAERLWPGAEGWFEGGEFRIACVGTMFQLLTALGSAVPEELTRLSNGLEVKKLLAPIQLRFETTSPFALTLDAWMTIRSEKGEVVTVANPPWNFWSGQQTSHGIWSALRKELAAQLSRLQPEEFGAVFSKRLFQKGRFGFDPGPAWNALDVGFSPNEQNMKVESSPAVELLAAVGLQRFRPRLGETRDWFIYSTWGQPLPPAVAAVAAAEAISCGPRTRYLGRVVSRGQYAALAYSTLLPGGSDE